MTETETHYTSKELGDTQQKFYDYYAQQSLTGETLGRFRAIQHAILRTLAEHDLPARGMAVADIGCGTGTQTIMWARDGHRAYGIDINEKLLTLGRWRAEREGLKVDFCTGSATQLPWDDASMDVCLVPELLEHVADWESCLSEVIRVLRSGGIMYLSTSNYLCPVQAEFNLPMYSWYPGFLKRRCERLAVTTRPELANYAAFPAVNWFSFFSLRKALRLRGVNTVLDRFDIADLAAKGPVARSIFHAVRTLPPLRWLAHVATPYTVVLAIKSPVMEADSGSRLPNIKYSTCMVNPIHKV